MSMPGSIPTLSNSARLWYRDLTEARIGNLLALQQSTLAASA